MEQSREINYLRIGSFVVMGLALIIIGTMLLGSGKLFKKTITIETYFNESVQGLSKGSPVKYSGVDIGHVEKITFVSQIYRQKALNGKKHYSRYIYVKMDINPNLFQSPKTKDITKIITRDVSHGLRIKLALQGLTGSAYLELSFVNPKQNPILPIDWQPQYYYIPSTTSMLTRFSDNVQYILDQLKDAKIEQLVNNTKALTMTTNETMKKIDDLLAHTSNQIKGAVDNAETITDNLRDFSSRIKDYPSQIIFSKAPPVLDPNNL